MLPAYGPHPSTPLCNDWQEARGEGQGTQAHLKESETKFHSPDPGRKLKLTGARGLLEATHPASHKWQRWNQVQVFWLHVHLFSTPSCQVSPGGMSMVHHSGMRWARRMWWARRAKAWAKVRKNSHWQVCLSSPKSFFNFISKYSHYKCTSGWILPQSEYTHKLEPYQKTKHYLLPEAFLVFSPSYYPAQDWHRPDI